jgi:thioesterase domain-containing protein
MSGERELELERYLHQQIPLSAAMGVKALSATTQSVVLSAPLAPNINHRRTAFGGSISALGILAAWSLLHLRLIEARYDCEVVIQSSQIDYDQPIAGPFAARSSLADGLWPTFLRTLARRKRARIEVQSSLVCEGVLAARLSGRFVAFLQEA